MPAPTKRHGPPIGAGARTCTHPGPPIGAGARTCTHPGRHFDPWRRHDGAESAHCPQLRPGLTDTAAILTTVIQVEPVLEIDPDAPRALIADDRELNYELVRDVLESLGWHATWARDGREALDMLLADSFDLLLLDLHMPGLSGEEVLRAVRAGAERPAPHVVVFTADPMAALNDEMLKLGFDGVLTKPVDLEALTRVAVTISEAKAR